MVEVVFHIGAHKCATSSVQQGLAAYAARLDHLGYVPPARAAAISEGVEPDPALKALVRFVARGDGPDEAAVADGLSRMIETKGKPRVVVSDEYMLGPMPGMSWRFYPRAEALRGVIERMSRRFETSVFLQSRETAAYLKSCHRFRVRFGLALGYDAFLDRFELESISWERLGRTLFAGAPYRWRTLPFETLVDPTRGATTADALRFVLPEWGLADVPLASANPSFAPLMRAATLVFRRAGVHVPNALAGRPAKALNAVEAAVAAAETDAAVALLREALAQARMPSDEQTARMILTQFDEERAPDGHLQALLRERFAADYAAFVEGYAGQSGTAATKPSLLARLTSRTR